MKIKSIFYLITILITCIGINAQEVVPIDSTDVFYRHLELNELVVVGSTGQTKLKDASSPISLLKGKDLQYTFSTNIVDAVASLPGVSQITTGGGIAKPVIRGLGYNRVVVVNDGIRQEGQQWGDEHGVELDGNAVESVEILKGPASLVYGSDAMAGVLVFKSDPIVPAGERQGSVLTEYQTNNGLINYSLRLAGNENDIVWSARYSEKFAHAYKNRYDHHVPNSQFHERAAALMGGINRHWGHSHLRLSAYQLTPSIVEGERDEVTGELVNESGRSTSSYRHGLPFQQVWHYKAVADNAFYLPNGKISAIVGYQQNRRQEYEESPAEYGLYLQLHTVNYDFNYAFTTSADWKLTLGVNGMWQKSVNRGEEYLIPDYRLFDIGAFVTSSRDFGALAVNAGMRIDNRHLASDDLFDEGDLRFKSLDRDFTGFTASVGAVWHVDDKTNVRLNAARGFRAPNISELTANGVHEGSLRYEVGNDALKPEFSWQFDLGADYTNKVISVQGAMFLNRISNYIFLHRTNETRDEQFATFRYDSGDARLIGGELTVDLHPIHRLHIGGTFDMVNAVQLHQPHDSRYLPFTPATRLICDIKYEFNHHGRHFCNTFAALEVDHTFRQSHYYRADDTETATPAYTLLNFSVGTELNINRNHVASLFVTAHNLADVAYQNHLSRLKYADVNNSTGRTGVYNIGRNITFKVIVPFNM